ncbi:MAG: hypothetical protein ACKO45_06745 [Cyanobium sp.]
MTQPLSWQVAALADQGIRRVAITWVNHAGAPLPLLQGGAGLLVGSVSGVGQREA